MMREDPTPRQIYSAIGKLDGKISSLEERIKRVESNFEFMRSALNEDGKQIAEISERCRLRGKQISQLVQRVGGCEEITGVFKLQDKHKIQQKNSFHWIVTTIISILAILVTILIYTMSRR